MKLSDSVDAVVISCSCSRAAQSFFEVVRKCRDVLRIERIGQPLGEIARANRVQVVGDRLCLKPTPTRVAAAHEITVRKNLQRSSATADRRVCREKAEERRPVEAYVAVGHARMILGRAASRESNRQRSHDTDGGAMKNVGAVVRVGGVLARPSHNARTL